MATFAMTLALLTTVLPAFGQNDTAQEDGSGDSPGATDSATARMWTCPVDSTGSAYPDDRGAGEIPFERILG